MTLGARTVSPTPSDYFSLPFYHLHFFCQFTRTHILRLARVHLVERKSELGE
ncbi:unnamed protein product [Tuber melanosporum]|uniref:(Perigord truffle) hypothetical protein n=1 Tax=Tuber melanosporum (strain Mel28) TaxID=656061 RepID=D5GMV4_TUBMM|nr:uncharacterized protein GSTUM_00010951001 [Tuber melanosporum]CAZ85847.1 unnamed protein product [Tuber melanosporum]